jgi:hypothetical protein
MISKIQELELQEATITQTASLTPVPQGNKGLNQQNKIKIDSYNNSTELQKQITEAFALRDFIFKSCYETLTEDDIYNYEGKAYLNSDGAEKLAAPFKIFEENKEIYVTLKDGTTKNLKDPDSLKGEIDCISITGIIGSKILGIKKDVYGGVKKVHMNNPKVDNDITYWLKKGNTNWRTRGIKQTVGLNSINWKNIKHIKPENCQSVTVGKTEKADSEQATEVWNNLLVLSHGNIEEAEKKCEELTTFIGKDGNIRKGSKRPQSLSQVALEILKKKLSTETRKATPLQKKNKDPEVEKLLKELRKYYLESNFIFETVLQRNGYTTDNLKNETDLFKLNGLIKEIEDEVRQ